MNDEKIIELYFTRSEDAITETDKKYGGACRSTAYGILGSHEDSEESLYPFPYHFLLEHSMHHTHLHYWREAA